MSARKIVVTGATKGLGRAMVEGFVAAGHTVAGCARNASSVSEMQADFGAPHDFRQVDVGDFASLEAWADDLLDRWGTPDLLVNNPAVIGENSPVWQVPPEEFSHVIDINIKGVFHVLRAFVPAMVERGQGVIVNFSSTWGRSTSPNVGPYCATKFAVEGLTKSLAQELPSSMAAVPLNPGVIHTELLEACFAEGAQSFPKPDQWATQAVPFILGLGPAHNGKSVNVPG